jgi:hypothetical protein
MSSKLTNFTNLIINQDQKNIKRIKEIEEILSIIHDEKKKQHGYIHEPGLHIPTKALDEELNLELTELKRNKPKQENKRVTIRGFEVKKTRASGRKKDHHRKKKSDTKVKKIIGDKKSSKNIKVKKNKTRRKKNQGNKK